MKIFAKLVISHHNFVLSVNLFYGTFIVSSSYPKKFSQLLALFLLTRVKLFLLTKKAIWRQLYRQMMLTIKNIQKYLSKVWNILLKSIARTFSLSRNICRFAGAMLACFIITPPDFQTFQRPCEWKFELLLML